MQDVNPLAIFFYTIIVVVLVYFYIREIFDNKKQRVLIENLNWDNERLNHMYDSIRGMKHDFMNVIQALEGYAKCNDVVGIQHMVDSICEESQEVCNLEVLNPHVINQPAIFHLLNQKYQEATKQHVSISFEIQVDLSKSPIDTYSFCRLLGIFLDNAIEAAKESKEKKVKVRFFKDIDCEVVEIQNTYNNYHVNVEKFFEKGYSSKGKDKNHGLGLWNAKRIIEMHPNLKLYTNSGDVFVQKLIMKEKRKCLEEMEK